MGNERLKYVYQSYTFDANEPVMCSKAFQLTSADLTRGFIDFICKHGKYRPTPLNPHVPIFYTNNLSEDSSIHWFSISRIFNSTQKYSSIFFTQKRRVENSFMFVTKSFEIRYQFLNALFFGSSMYSFRLQYYAMNFLKWNLFWENQQNNKNKGLFKWSNQNLVVNTEKKQCAIVHVKKSKLSKSRRKCRRISLLTLFM